MSTNGTEVTNFVLPTYVNEQGISDITINQDGTLAYFTSGLRLYKVISNSVIKIFDANEHTEIGQFVNIQTQSNGMRVYIQTIGDYRLGNVWQMDENGLNISLTVDPYEVVRYDSCGAGLSTFAISDNAGVIAFVLRGYWDNTGLFQWNTELFTKTHPLIYAQMTDNVNDVSQYWLDISGDGGRIVFMRNDNSDTTKYYAVDKDGNNLVEVGRDNLGLLQDMDLDGSLLVYENQSTGGRLVRTDGVWVLDLMPLGMRAGGGSLDLSYDNKICFLDYMSGLSGVYIGHLYVQDANVGNPVIEEITFDPPVFPRDDPGARIKLLAKISDPGGLEEITQVEVNGIIEGRLRNYGEIPIWFQFPPRDDGIYPDETAGDGIFTTEGGVAGAFDQYDQMTVRVVARDVDNSIALCDVLLDIETGRPQEETIPSALPDEYALLQNYPNPCNPKTTITFSVPRVGLVRMRIFDLLGREVKTLLDKAIKPGTYQLTCDVSDMPAGVYFYQLKAPSCRVMKKMIVLK